MKAPVLNLNSPILACPVCILGNRQSTSSKKLKALNFFLIHKLLQCEDTSRKLCCFVFLLERVFSLRSEQIFQMNVFFHKCCHNRKGYISIYRAARCCKAENPSGKMHCTNRTAPNKMEQEVGVTWCGAWHEASTNVLGATQALSQQPLCSRSIAPGFSTKYTLMSLTTTFLFSQNISRGARSLVFAFPQQNLPLGGGEQPTADWLQHTLVVSFYHWITIEPQAGFVNVSNNQITKSPK